MSVHPHIKRVIFTDQQIKDRIIEVGKEITNDYKDSKELVLIGVLKGSFMYMADLVRAINLPNTHVSVDFMSISSYGHGTTSSGVVKINMDLKADIAGKDVIVVEDIIDTGLTLQSLLVNLQARNPASLQVSVLLRKKEALKVEVPCKYIGFDIPIVFIVGYGLDFAEKYRELPYLGELKEEAYKN
ncbi:hypoxanthine phosphoribosyltransferase [Cavenderia fasciculata]|uniref:Hypoxanthine phosphoribosyltransferase n=1 Tax=Cavenderia fasciculata TaxID=261658 RepID=F4PZ04_CACFS|nr:hypoxanthine phosphoribosyltransferase [Cavenderia fasciculata]EGG19033.1 hypoxanthine phosphoribosyltransferase [Cavenderia fasciculata]|eukprot:XP_004366666.1 hypoxanthine phosphoribosyltransferase [Cavenderia fasciculata]